MHLGLSAYVDALGWLIENQHRRFSHQPATESDFLLIAAGQCRDRREDRRRFDPEFPYVISRHFFFASEMDRAHPRKLIKRSQRNIRADCEIQDHTMTTAILRDVGDAGFD